MCIMAFACSLKSKHPSRNRRFLDDRLICKCKSNYRIRQLRIWTQVPNPQYAVFRVYFEISDLFAQIAQLVEQRTENPRVTGSIPVLGTLQVWFNGRTPAFQAGDVGSIPITCSFLFPRKQYVCGVFLCPQYDFS